MNANTSPRQTEKAVLTVLAGEPLHEAAARVPMEPDDLADAVTVYQAAGYAALEAHTDLRSWYQVRIQFADWDTAEQAAVAYLRPELQQAEGTGLVAAWWFMRKAPCWRLRFLLGADATPTQMRECIGRMLDAMVSWGVVARWWETIYEPETAVFGGPEGIDTAHTLFHTDSQSFLDYLSQPDPTAPPERTIGRRELSILLLSVLMREAGQDWYEQGDVWNLVEDNRPLAPGTSMDRLSDMKSQLSPLMTVDAGPASTLMKGDGPLASFAHWAASFEAAGKALGDAARGGKLSRGVRDILAHHVIFHWNRMGLSARTQSILARAARGVILGT